MRHPELIDWLLKQIDDDLMWAREASRRGQSQAVEGGVHWQWETPDDKVVTPDPGLLEFVGEEDGGAQVDLRSRETWPTQWGGGELPQFAIHDGVEIPSAVGGHIIRHDPARVIRDLTARRRSVVRCSENLGLRLADEFLRDMAATYAERPGYQPEWQPAGN